MQALIQPGHPRGPALLSLTYDHIPVRVTPAQIKEALAESRKRYAEEHAKDEPGLEQRAQHAREASESIEREGAGERPLSREAR